MAVVLAAGSSRRFGAADKRCAILLGDMPDIWLETLHALQRQATRSDIIRPRYADRPGHPVLFGRDFWPELETLDGDDGAREVIRRHRDRYREHAVEDPGVCRDIDTPAQLHTLGGKSAP
ncbi:NTP transferase domain-containing protein [Halomonas kalidii]|uniref:NTP transferase domain-containing protein n=1 Tax=Halomonas kalidii TaxID=3043293 RepID=A0ABT6VGQ8_9GAMM|nr:NTP transferase domain-containing protein [Halomonas kalidii]MDI5933163.1 NTP transferase domain-containing protein [Halomonas kalidii]